MTDTQKTGHWIEAFNIINLVHDKGDIVDKVALVLFKRDEQLTARTEDLRCWKQIADEYERTIRTLTAKMKQWEDAEQEKRDD